MLLGAGLMAAVAAGLGVCTAGGLPAAEALPADTQPPAPPHGGPAARRGDAGDVRDVSDVGAARLAPERGLLPPVLAQEWTAGRDPAGWLVSEKLDGVRALWDGQRLVFRSGRVLALPSVIRARLPKQPLDGELWLGRGRFEQVSALLRSERVADAEAWRGLQYHVFELPGGGGAFAERAARLRQIAATSAWPGLVAAAQQPVADAAALKQRLDAVVSAGGEGLMLHRADAPVANGRSPWLCKYKPLQDAEATVIGHRAGRGRHEGRLGALQVRGEDGQVFFLGTGFSDAQRGAPPAIGARVTYSHHGHTEQGVPRFARFVREAAVF
jgi:DNA ligase-1